MLAAESTTLRVIVVIFAIIGLIAVISLLGMSIVHGSMMNMMNSGGMAQKMASLCGNMMAAHR